MGDRIITTLFDTSAGREKTSPGIEIRLNQGNDGAQIALKLSDGIHSAESWQGFEPRPNPFDGQWTFLAITFDGTALNRKLRIYGGDETRNTRVMNAPKEFDAITGTGVSLSPVVSIGDGLGGFANSSSHLGLLDGIYFTNTVENPKQIEIIRQASLK
jgi:hypothetical protein